jgi:hypothetical protein
MTVMSTNLGPRMHVRLSLAPLKVGTLARSLFVIAAFCRLVVFATSVRPNRYGGSVWESDPRQDLGSLRLKVWERFGKELQTPKTDLSSTESTGRMFSYVLITR